MIHNKKMQLVMKSILLGKSRLFILLVMTLALAAVFLLFQLSAAPEKISHVILISIDTCRADYLSCYGYPAKTTPNIDALAEEGILFNRVVSPIPLTLPSHSSIMTGNIPPYHGVRDNDRFQLGQSNITLAEILQEQGYTTGAIVGSFVLDSQFGLDQGFDSYDDSFDEVMENQPQIQRRGGEVTRHALQWLQEHKSEDFFLFLHYFDPHTEYVPPEPFASRPELNRYAAEIAYADYCIGQVFDKLKQLGIYDSTLIIVTADHGESLGEHQEATHSYFVYQSTIQVGLIFKLPGKSKAQKIDDFVGLIDIMPTTLGLMRIDIPDHVNGRNLCRYFKQEQHSEKQRYIYCESLHPTQYGCAGLRSVVSDPWKYIHTTRAELYHLRQDPQEKNNLIADNPQQAQIMQRHLKGILADQTRADARDSILEIDDQSIKRLESLGYISAGQIKDSFTDDSDQEDPKDFLPLYEMQRLVRGFIRIKLYDKAWERAVKLVEARPDNAEFRLLLGQVAFEQNNFSEAVTQLSEGVKIQPDDHKGRLRLGQAFLKQNLYAQAMEQFREAVRLKPTTEGYHSMATVSMRQGKMNEAFSYYNEVLLIDPTDNLAHHKLGLIWLARQKPDQARQHFIKALKGDQKNDRVHACLAMALTQLGRYDEASNHFNEAIRLNPDNAIAHGSYAAHLVQQGKLDQALEHYMNVARINPKNYQPHRNIAMLYSRMGKYGEAIRAAQKAVDLALAAGQEEAARQIQKSLESYKKQQSSQ